MGIFRGIGGTGNSTDDGVVDAVTAQAVIATNKATEAATSATSAYNSAQSASTSKDTATTQANAAQSSANTASTQATNASTSATSAATSATSATASATTATTKASEAATSATNAATSETNAATSATTATTKASEAATSATTATTKAGEASTSATNAASSATSASTSASTATTKASEASTSAANAASSYDDFDDRYLGAKSSAPSADNDGDALITGALYFDTSSNAMKVYSGSAWLDAYASLSGALIATNNLSDLNNAGTARTNLGLGTAATTDASAYATAAQGTTADNALPKSGGAMTGAITTNSTFDGRDVSVDGTKLDGIEASADVTDTANVTAAGALMDSELTSEASVKALNQGVATTDSPTFGGVTATGQGVFKVDSTDQIKIGDSSLTNFWTLRAGTNLLFKDNGTERMRIDSSGRVGIGTSSPSVPVHVYKSQSSPTIVAKFENPADEAIVEIKSKNTDLGVLQFADTEDANVGAVQYSHSDNSMRFKSNDSERMRIDSSGNVGIGTTSPSGTVDVNGNVLAGGQILSSSAKLQVNGFQRTGTIYLHEGTTPTANNYPLSTTSGGELRWDGNKVFNAGNDGSGSGLDADTVDGLQASQFLRSDASDSMSGTLTINQVTGGTGAILKATSSYTSGTLYGPGLRWLEGDGTSIAGIRGVVSNGTNVLMLGTGWLDQEVQIKPDGMDVVGTVNCNYLRADRLYANNDGSTGYFFNDSGTRTAYTGGDFYIQSITNSYNYATNQYLGFTSGDNIFTRGNRVLGNNFEFATDGSFKVNAGYGSLQYAYGVRAWGRFEMSGTHSWRDDEGFSSITDRGTGRTQLSFTNTMPNSLYAACVQSGITSSTSAITSTTTYSHTTTSFYVAVEDVDAGLVDRDHCSVIVVR